MECWHHYMAADGRSWLPSMASPWIGTPSTSMWCYQQTRLRRARLRAGELPRVNQHLKQWSRSSETPKRTAGLAHYAKNKATTDKRISLDTGAKISFSIRFVDSRVSTAHDVYSIILQKCPNASWQAMLTLHSEMYKFFILIQCSYLESFKSSDGTHVRHWPNNGFASI